LLRGGLILDYIWVVDFLLFSKIGVAEIAKYPTGEKTSMGSKPTAQSKEKRREKIVMKGEATYRQLPVR
jgi:hypothetical protein